VGDSCPFGRVAWEQISLTPALWRRKLSASGRSKTSKESIRRIAALSITWTVSSSREILEPSDSKNMIRNCDTAEQIQAAHIMADCDRFGAHRAARQPPCRLKAVYTTLKNPPNGSAKK
jgi:hypothetical protein